MVSTHTQPAQLLQCLILWEREKRKADRDGVEGTDCDSRRVLGSPRCLSYMLAVDDGTKASPPVVLFKPNSQQQDLGLCKIISQMTFHLAFKNALNHGES